MEPRQQGEARGLNNDGDTGVGSLQTCQLVFLDPETMQLRKLAKFRWNRTYARGRNLRLEDGGDAGGRAGVATFQTCQLIVVKLQKHQARKLAKFRWNGT